MRLLGVHSRELTVRTLRLSYYSSHSLQFPPNPAPCNNTRSKYVIWGSRSHLVSRSVLLFLIPVYVLMSGRAISTMSYLWHLLLQSSKGGFGIPVPWSPGSEEQIHLFQRSLIAFRIESPHEGNADGVCDSEEVICLFSNTGKANGK